MRKLKLNSLESTKQNPMFWHKRQSLAQIRSQKPMFLQLMEQSKQCMNEHPEFHGNDASSIKKQIACEVIHPQTLVISHFIHTLQISIIQVKLIRPQQKN